MAYKTHRAIRHSRCVSSEIGVAISAMVGDPRPTRRKVAKEEIAAILQRLSPAERRAMLREALASTPTEPSGAEGDGNDA